MGNNYLKDKYKTNFIHHASKPLNIKQKDFSELMQEEFITSIEQKIQTKVVDNLDNVLLDLLYEEFNNSDATDLIVLDKTEFKEFLLKYVPMYLEDKESKKTKYIFHIKGCHDATNFVLDLNKTELKIAQKICKKSQETSTYGCMPKVCIVEYAEKNKKYYGINEEEEENE